jgi:hypothetical protein
MHKPLDLARILPTVQHLLSVFQCPPMGITRDAD